MFVVVREESHEKTNPTLSTMIFFFPRYTRHEYSLLKVLDEQLDDGSLARINDAHPGFFPDVESVNQRSCYETSGLGDICIHLQTFEIYLDLFPNSSYYNFNFYWCPQTKELSSENPQTFKSTPRKQPTLKGNYVKKIHWLTIKSWGTPMRFVLLRNPWGMLEWRGDWGDLSTFVSFIGCWRIILSLMMSHTHTNCEMTKTHMSSYVI